MLRLSIALSLLALLAAPAAAQDKYPDTFDQLDMKALLSDKARIEAAIQCLDEDGDGACRPAGKLLKSVLAEIVKTDCAKCTETQKEKVGSFFAHVSQHYPEQMKKLLDKYDPSKEYRAKYAQKWAADGIKV
ncbi:ejaculatory bulb-specific protein 3-like [Schistocerca piceifrons]|uniref:ejaculatory bulb-specific protein 3-like n=1 Tax=Schistocerca piceifrons TaxID=274613 RepID=UPI001F5F6321|nr:ejaculatory bulb-specific protein 3-like [Schistocerca piceifrons]